MFHRCPHCPSRLATHRELQRHVFVRHRDEETASMSTSSNPVTTSPPLPTPNSDVIIKADEPHATSDSSHTPDIDFSFCLSSATARPLSGTSSQSTYFVSLDNEDDSEESNEDDVDETEDDFRSVATVGLSKGMGELCCISTAPFTPASRVPRSANGIVSADDVIHRPVSSDQPGDALPPLTAAFRIPETPSNTGPVNRKFCEVCGTMFRNDRLLQRHIDKHHTPVKISREPSAAPPIDVDLGLEDSGLGSLSSAGIPPVLGSSKDSPTPLLPISLFNDVEMSSEVSSLHQNALEVPIHISPSSQPSSPDIFPEASGSNTSLNIADGLLSPLRFHEEAAPSIPCSSRIRLLPTKIAVRPSIDAISVYFESFDVHCETNQEEGEDEDEDEEEEEDPWELFDSPRRTFRCDECCARFASQALLNGHITRAHLTSFDDVVDLADVSGRERGHVESPATKDDVIDDVGVVDDVTISSRKCTITIGRAHVDDYSSESPQACAAKSDGGVEAPLELSGSVEVKEDVKEETEEDSIPPPRTSSRKRNRVPTYRCEGNDAAIIKQEVLSKEKKPSVRVPRRECLPEVGSAEYRKIRNEDAKRRRDESREKHKCPHCDFTNAFPSKVKRHMEVNHVKGRFPCNYCDLRLDDQHERRKHESDAHPKVHRCTECGYRNRCLPMVRRHVQQVHVQGISCPVPGCATTFARRTLRRHLREHHPSPFSLSSHSSNPLHPSISRHIPSSAFACPHCDFTADAQHDLEFHIKCSHLHSLLCPIPDCTARMTLDDLDFHLSTMHPDEQLDMPDPNRIVIERDGVCIGEASVFSHSTGRRESVAGGEGADDDAAESTTCSTNREEDQALSSDEEEDKSTAADKDGFARPGDIPTKRNRGNGAFDCSSCSSSFATAIALRKHIKRVHERSYSESRAPRIREKKFVCDWERCDMRFADAVTLDGHMNKHRGLRPHSCSSCRLHFHSRNSLARHLSSHHQSSIKAYDEVQQLLGHGAAP